MVVVVVVVVVVLVVLDVVVVVVQIYAPGMQTVEYCGVITPSTHEIAVIKSRENMLGVVVVAVVPVNSNSSNATT